MGLILPQVANVKISSRNYKRYEEIGYIIPRHLDNKNKLRLDIGEVIKVHVLDLPRTSHQKVKVNCDYCGKPYESNYDVVFNITEHLYNNKCSCKDCFNIKLSELQQHIRERDDGVIPLYRDRNWLYNEYIVKNRTAQSIANQCNIDIRNIFVYIKKFEMDIKVIDIHEKISYELLHTAYVLNKLTTREIATKYHCDEQALIDLLDEYNIQRRTSKESMAIYYNEKGGRELKSEQVTEMWKREGFKEKMCIINKHHANKLSNRIKHSANMQGIEVADWNGFLTSKNNRIRNNIDYKNWRISVFKRDNYTCQCCNKRSGNGYTVHLQAHHKENFADNPELRLDINNGFTLCRECHDSRVIGSFHNLYGTCHNNTEQLNEYIKLKQSEVV